MKKIEWNNKEYENFIALCKRLVGEDFEGYEYGDVYAIKDCISFNAYNNSLNIKLRDDVYNYLVKLNCDKIIAMGIDKFCENIEYKFKEEYDDYEYNNDDLEYECIEQDESIGISWLGRSSKKKKAFLEFDVELLDVFFKNLNDEKFRDKFLSLDFKYYEDKKVEIIVNNIQPDNYFRYLKYLKSPELILDFLCNFEDIAQRIEYGRKYLDDEFYRDSLILTINSTEERKKYLPEIKNEIIKEVILYSLKETAEAIHDEEKYEVIIRCKNLKKNEKLRNIYDLLCGALNGIFDVSKKDALMGLKDITEFKLYRNIVSEYKNEAVKRLYSVLEKIYGDNLSRECEWDLNFDNENSDELYDLIQKNKMAFEVILESRIPENIDYGNCDMNFSEMQMPRNFSSYRKVLERICSICTIDFSNDIIKANIKKALNTNIAPEERAESIYKIAFSSGQEELLEAFKLKKLKADEKNKLLKKFKYGVEYIYELNTIVESFCETYMEEEKNLSEEIEVLETNFNISKVKIDKNSFSYKFVDNEKARIVFDEDGVSEIECSCQPTHRPIMKRIKWLMNDYQGEKCKHIFVLAKRMLDF